MSSSSLLYHSKTQLLLPRGVTLEPSSSHLWGHRTSLLLLQCLEALWWSRAAIIPWSPSFLLPRGMGRVMKCCWEASTAHHFLSRALHLVIVRSYTAKSVAHSCWALYWSRIGNIEVEHNYGLNDGRYIYHDNNNVLRRTDLFMWGSLRLASIMRSKHPQWRHSGHPVWCREAWKISFNKAYKHY